MKGDNEHLAALWLSTLQRVTDRVAHDIRNTLNAVAVNVEVVRSRAARGGEAATIAPFAAAAAAQVEILSAQADALIAILRPPAAPVDLGTVLGRLATLLRGGAEKSEIELDLPVSTVAVASSAGGDATRLALSAAFLAALERDGRVVCRLGTERTPTVYISCDAGGPLTLAKDIRDTVTRAGILLTPAPDGIAVTFPPSLRD